MQRQEREDLLTRLRMDAQRIATRFGLTFRAIVAEHPRVKSRYGACFSNGLIKIRLNHAKTGQPLKYSSLIDTLCHELAHLRHFDHSSEFKRFFWQLLGWARREGIYTPASPRGNQGPPRPVAAHLETRNGVAVFGGEVVGREAPARQTQWTELLARELAASTNPSAPTQPVGAQAHPRPARSPRRGARRPSKRRADESPVTDQSTPARRQLSLF